MSALINSGIIFFAVFFKLIGIGVQVAMFFFLLGSTPVFLASLAGSQFSLSFPRTDLNTSGYSSISHFFIFSHSSSMRISFLDFPSGSFDLSSFSFS